MRPQGRRLRRGLRGCGWAVGRGCCGVRGGGGGGTGRRGGGGGGGACRGGVGGEAGRRRAAAGESAGSVAMPAGPLRPGGIAADHLRRLPRWRWWNSGSTRARVGTRARGRLSFTARIYVPNARQHGTAPRPSPEQIIGGHGFRKGSVHQREGDAARDAVCQSHREPFGQSDSAGRDGAQDAVGRIDYDFDRLKVDTPPLPCAPDSSTSGRSITLRVTPTPSCCIWGGVGQPGIPTESASQRQLVRRRLPRRHRTASAALPGTGRVPNDRVIAGRSGLGGDHPQRRRRGSSRRASRCTCLRTSWLRF